MELEFPRTFGAESDTAQIKRLSDYMYSLTEQLNFVLNNLDTGNFSPDTAAMVALPGRDMPMVSVSRLMVLAVPIMPQAPLHGAQV